MNFCGNNKKRKLYIEVEGREERMGSLLVSFLSYVFHHPKQASITIFTRKTMLNTNNTTTVIVVPIVCGN